jgi:hypothetical protein
MVCGMPALVGNRYADLVCQVGTRFVEVLHDVLIYCAPSLPEYLDMCRCHVLTLKSSVSV